MTSITPEAVARVARATTNRQAPPATLVIFGAGGDLTKRLVVPALYNLVRAGRLADGFSIVGVGRGEITTELLAPRPAGHAAVARRGRRR